MLCIGGYLWVGGVKGRDADRCQGADLLNEGYLLVVINPYVLSIVESFEANHHFPCS